MTLKQLCNRFVAAILLLLAGCSSNPGDDGRIVIGYTAGTGVVPLLFAEKNGYFRENGLNVELRLLRNGAIAVPGIVSGSLQASALPPPVLLQAVDSGIDLKGLTGLSVIEAGMKTAAIVAAGGSGIHNPSDLRGKRIGVSGIGSISQILFRHWLDMKGIDHSGIVYLEISFSSMPDVIKLGHVDAVLIPEPLLSSLLKKNDARVIAYFLGDMEPGNLTMMTAVSGNWAKNHKEQIPALVAAIVKGGMYAKSHPDEAIEIAGEYLGLPDDMLDNIPNEPIDTTLNANQLQWWLDIMNGQQMVRTDIRPENLIYGTP